MGESDAASAAEQVAIHFIDVWAEEVRSLAPQVRHIRNDAEAASRAADYGEVWSPTDRDLYDRFCRLWAAEHHLVWAAHQLEIWIARLCKERGQDPPGSNAVLRNALEHLNEAMFPDENTATPGPRNWALKALPGS